MNTGELNGLVLFALVWFGLSGLCRNAILQGRRFSHKVVYPVVGLAPMYFSTAPATVRQLNLVKVGEQDVSS